MVELIINNPQIPALLKRVDSADNSACTAMIFGETGKGLFSEINHSTSSRRINHFVKFNQSSILKNLPKTVENGTIFNNGLEEIPSACKGLVIGCNAEYNKQSYTKTMKLRIIK